MSIRVDPTIIRRVGYRWGTSVRHGHQTRSASGYARSYRRAMRRAQRAERRILRRLRGQSR